MAAGTKPALKLAASLRFASLGQSKATETKLAMQLDQKRPKEFQEVPESSKSCQKSPCKLPGELLSDPLRLYMLWKAARRSLRATK